MKLEWPKPLDGIMKEFLTPKEFKQRFLLFRSVENLLKYLKLKSRIRTITIEHIPDINAWQLNLADPDPTSL